MEQLLELLKDGHARTIEMLALELDTTVSDVRRKLEFMENMGIIKRVSMSAASCGSGCGGCTGCSAGTKGIAVADTATSGVCGKGTAKSCSSCMPDKEILNMGEMWKVI
ncbi:MAG: DeoR family transcriptional regulator [Lachnospiraceae bacterium]|nr:DeoR family transcriptional regulator [Lachnospiraceae bacterium]